MGSLCAFAHLRILATSDVHMHLTGWDALRDVVVPGRGLDVLACRIEAARRDAPGACMLVDNGDAVQGTPLGITCAGWPDGAAHPWPGTLDALDYDAVGLGNHDFDFGVPFLESVVAQTKAPTLCASFASGGVHGVVPSTMLQREVTCSDGTVRSLHIGVTSVLPPQTALWSHRFLSGRIRFESGAKAAARAVAGLRAQGADIVVMLCHSGLSTCGDDDSENFAATLARDVTGIDALIMGHTHQLFPAPGGPAALHGIPAVMPGYGAEALGVIDLDLGWDGQGWQVTRSAAALRTPLDGDTPSTGIGALTAPAIAETNKALDVELTQSATGFHTYFDMLQSGPTGALVARAMTRHIAAQVAGTPLSDLPLIASVTATAVGGRAGPRNYVEVPPGVVRARHVAMLAPFSDSIWAVRLTGSDLWAWAERSTAYFAPRADALARLVDDTAPYFNFDALHGLRAVIDPFQPRMFDPAGRVLDPNARRVMSLTYQGEPVALTQHFLVAVTSYRGAGGGTFPGLPDDPHVVRTDIDLLTALREDVAGALIPETPVPSVWDFADKGGTRVVIETSPNARAHLHEIARFDPQVLGINAAGFLELSVAI